jgi:hypothetical protein
LAIVRPDFSQSDYCQIFFTLLSGGFKKSQNLFAFLRARIDRADMFAPLHFPDSRYASFFFYRVIRNIFSVFRRFRCVFGRFDRRRRCLY